MAAITAALVLASMVVLLAGGALFAAGIHQAHAQTPPDDFVAGEVLVKFEPGASGQERAEAHRQNEGEVEEIIPDIGVRVVDVPAGQERSIVAAYERNPNVSYAELNSIIRIADHGTNDPRVDDQWQYNNTGQTITIDRRKQFTGTVDADIDAFEAWHVTTGSSSVDIAILDTGIDGNHEDLQDKISVENQKNFSNGRTVDDKYGHGTHVAGIAAATTNNATGVAGTCSDCSLYNVKVVGNDGSGKVSWLAKGITWAADNGAEVISMSLGTSRGSDTLRNAVNYAWSKNAVLVAAAGNYGENDPFYPAAYEPNDKVTASVIAVAATNHKDVKPKFSNYGKKWVDIGAPGVNILSTLRGNSDNPEGRYGFKSGTSMATPHVAGVAGLVWAATDSSGTNLCSTNECVRNRIEAGADKIPGLAVYWTEGRRLNANGAVTSPPSGP